MEPYREMRAARPWARLASLSGWGRLGEEGGQARGVLAFAMLFAVVSLLPVAWMFKTNAAGRVVSPGELFAPPSEVFTQGFSLLPYVSVLYDLDFLRPLANGVITAATTAVGCFLIGSMAAYAIARRGFRPAAPS
jgi:ABC-type glycerol-3-phosphate transport system permease component